MSEAHARWRKAPVLDLRRLARDGPLLILAPHPDDETIGCGGLIQQAVRAGMAVFIDFLTDGSRSHTCSASYPRERLAALRRAEATAAAELLGVPAAALRFWPEEDSCLPAEGEAAVSLIGRLRKRLAETGARTLFVTWIDDPHCDHKAAFALAADSVAGQANAPRLYGYPVWSWTSADMPRHPREGEVARLDITAELARKRQALARHRSQLGQVITDDPEGFCLTAEQVALFMQSFETFIAVLPDEA